MFLCSCSRAFPSQAKLDYHLRRSGELEPQNGHQPVDKAALAAFFAQNGKKTETGEDMTDCAACSYNSDMRVRAESELALANKALSDAQAALAEEKERQVALAQTPSHIPGLCGDVACASCVAQAQQIGDVVTAQVESEFLVKGRVSALDDVEKALTWGKGPAFAHLITELVRGWVAQGRPEPQSEPSFTITAS